MFKKDGKRKEVYVIICAAIKFGNGVVIRGHRHNDCLRTASGVSYISLADVKGRVDGFMDSHNEFVDRTEAKIIATESGQAIEDHDPVLLYSEDLY